MFGRSIGAACSVGCRIALITIAGWLALFVSTATAQAPAAEAKLETLRIDPNRSHAEFSLRAMLLMQVRGQFTMVSGSVKVDREKNLGWVDARIDARAVDMGNREREDWARSDEFFDSANHPEIRFVSEPISRTLLRDGGPLRGHLRLRGMDQALELTVLPSTCERPGRDCAMQVQGTISRSEFGMRSKRAVLGDKVTLNLAVFVEPMDDAAPDKSRQAVTPPVNR